MDRKKMFGLFVVAILVFSFASLTIAGLTGGVGVVLRSDISIQLSNADKALLEQKYKVENLMRGFILLEGTSCNENTCFAQLFRKGVVDKPITTPAKKCVSLKAETGLCLEWVNKTIREINTGLSEDSDRQMAEIINATIKRNTRDELLRKTEDGNVTISARAMS